MNHRSRGADFVDGDYRGEPQLTLQGSILVVGDDVLAMEPAYDASQRVNLAINSEANIPDVDCDGFHEFDPG